MKRKPIPAVKSQPAPTPIAIHTGNIIRFVSDRSDNPPWSIIASSQYEVLEIVIREPIEVCYEYWAKDYSGEGGPEGYYEFKVRNLIPAKRITIDEAIDIAKKLCE